MQGSSRRSVAGSAFGLADSGAPRVVVLGASGFMGRHCSEWLVHHGIDCLRVGRAEGPLVDVGLDLVRDPVANLRELLRSYGPTAIINCSGAVRGSASDMMRTNAAGAHTLVVATTTAAPAAKIVQLGSSAEYGAQNQKLPIAEDAPERPGSPYGYSKLAATQIALQGQMEGLNVTVLRVFNVSGPLSPSSTMLGGMVKKLRRGEPVVVDSLDGWRDYIDVRDVAAAAGAAAFALDAPPLLNIGSGHAVRTGDWLTRLVEYSGTGARPVVGIDPERAHKSSATEVSWQCADISLAQRALGWSPRITLDQSLRDTWSASAA